MPQEELQAKYDALEAEKSALNPENPDDRFRRTVLENEQAGIAAQMKESERLQRQAEEVADVQLPEDYDARWGVTGANDEIRNLISQVKEYAFAQHNDELAALLDEHAMKERDLQDRIQTLTEDGAQFEDKIDALNNELAMERAAKHAAISATQDAESKRDNAVAQLEEAQAEAKRQQAQAESYKRQIDELEGMLRTYKSRQVSGNKGGLVLTSTLKPESDDDREARLKRERLEQLNRQLARRGADPLPVPPAVSFSTAQEPTEEAPAQQEEGKPADTHSDERFSENAVQDDAVEGKPTDGTVALTPAEVVARLAELEGRVERLEAGAATLRTA
ncbi:hypothetical protein [Paenibacillus humicus]|uniref:hypothetical protein n=1 Tax=Paenibacillus humicus TaxID=412861 RepID=UPI003F157F14